MNRKMLLKSSAPQIDIHQSVFFISANLAYVIDKDGNFLDCNKNFLNFLGFKSTHGIFDIYRAMAASGHWQGQEQILAMKASDMAVLQAGLFEPTLSQLSLLATNGSIADYQVIRTPLQTEHEVAALLVTLKDITAQKQIQKQISNLNNELLKSNLSDDALMLPKNHFDKPAKTPRILIVEDNKTAQFAAQSILMKVNALTDSIASESELLTIFENGKYDLILMDIGLDKTNGFLLSKIIRTKEKNTNFHVPIVLLTGFDTDSLAEECNFYRLEGALSKPLTLDKAKQLVQHFIFDSNAPVAGLKHSH